MKKNDYVIGIIGAGKFAHSFTSVLVKNGFIIECVMSRHKQSAQLLAKKVGANNYSDKLTDLSNDCNLVFICVPDDQIRKVAADLSKLELRFRDILFIHTSGSKSSEELLSLKKKGASTASFHIMQTFPSKEETNITEAIAAIESKQVSVRKDLDQLAKILKLRPLLITSKDKTLYHIGGVFASNFLSANFLSAEKMFPVKLKRRTGEILGQITKFTLKNIIDNTPSKAISGPIERGDVRTVKSHIKSIRSLGNSETNKLMLISYLVQSKILLKGIEIKNKKPSVKYLEILKYLNNELNQLLKIKLKD